MLEVYGLYPGQERILLLLWEGEGLSLSKLAEQLGVQAPTITKMISRMAAAGVVERRAAPHDSRTTQVFLTPQGRDLKEGVERAYAQLEADTVAQLSEEEQRWLRHLLEKVTPNLSRNGTAPDVD